MPNGITGSGGGVSLGTSSQPATNTLIGGTGPGERNVISGNRADGLIITGGNASNNVVAGNYIGVAGDGLTAMGNAKGGIVSVGAIFNLIGGAAATSQNIIAYNGLDGVWLASTFGAGGTPGTNNVVRGNLIYSNGVSVVANGGYAAGVTLLGPNLVSSNILFGNIYQDIDRGGDGPTPNTPGGAANSPMLTSAQQGSTKLGWDAGRSSRFDQTHRVHSGNRHTLRGQPSIYPWVHSRPARRRRRREFQPGFPDHCSRWCKSAGLFVYGFSRAE